WPGYRRRCPLFLSQAPVGAHPVRVLPVPACAAQVAPGAIGCAGAPQSVHQIPRALPDPCDSRLIAQLLLIHVRVPVQKWSINCAAVHWQYAGPGHSASCVPQIKVAVYSLGLIASRSIHEICALAFQLTDAAFLLALGAHWFDACV